MGNAESDRPSLTTEQQRLADRVLRAATGVPIERRSAYVREQCGDDDAIYAEVMSLLAHRDQLADGSFLEKPAELVGIGDTDALASELLPATETKAQDAGAELSPGLSPGTMIGPYKLLERIGSGGFGEVFAAEQTEPVRRKVALKIVNVQVLQDKEVLARFEAERQALAMMEHPNVATVFDAGITPPETGSRPYFAMELVKGEKVTDYCDRHRLGLRDRLELFATICEAIQHAHQKGVIHRDIKPSNILVTYQDEKPVPKVIDFGVAKAINQPLTQLTIHTEFGKLIGTPEYMSPEQAEMTGTNIDTRSDIYSLGVLLYELLTGTLPFESKDLRKAAFAEIVRIIREVEPPKPSTKLTRLTEDQIKSAVRSRKLDYRTLQKNLSGELDWLTMKALEKARQDRYETASDFAGQVRKFLNNEALDVGPPSTVYRVRKFVRRHRVGVVAGAIVAIALMTSAAVSIWFAVNEAEQRRIADDKTTLANQREQEAITARDAEADAKELAESRAEEIRLRAIAANAMRLGRDDPLLATLVMRELPERDGVWGAGEAFAASNSDPIPVVVLRGHENRVKHGAFSPDGSRIVTASFDRTSRIWNADGTGEPVVLPHDETVLLAAFSPDGSRIVTASGDAVRIWNAGGAGDPVVLPHDEKVRLAAFSPDGSRVVTASGNTARIWNADGTGQSTVLRGHVDLVLDAAFSPDGSSVVTASKTGTARIWNTDGIGESIVLRGPTMVLLAAFSPDGSRILTVSSDNAARIWNADGTGKPVVLRHDENVWYAEFSPDGSHLVTASADGAARIWNTDGAGAPIVLRHDDEVWHAEFSPDGSRVVTASGVIGCVWSTNGAGEPVVLRGHGAFVADAAFSPDGSHIITVSDDYTARIWNTDGTGESIVLPGDDHLVPHAPFSPDGSRLVTTSVDTALIWNADGTGEPVVLRGHTDFVFDAAFSPDGSHIVTASQDNTARIWNADGRGEPIVLRGHDRWVIRAAFSPDGSRIVTASSDNTSRIWNADGTGEPIVLRGHDGSVSRAAFSPDGSRIVTASSDRTARIWNADGTGEPIVLRGHDHSVSRAAFSPDGSRIVTASWDRTARIWNADGMGEPILLRGHDDQVCYAEFSPDGSRVVTASYDNTARIWNADGAGESIAMRGPAMLTHAAFSPDGTRIVTASYDNTARIWSTDGAGEPIVLRHDDVIFQATFSPDGSHIVTDTKLGTVRIWSRRLWDWQYMRPWLFEITNEILTPEQRMEYLYETEAEARQRHQADVERVAKMLAERQSTPGE